MSSTLKILKPPQDYYDDEVLYGPRREATRLLELINATNNSECVIYSIGTFVDKQQWSIKNLIGYDKRIKAMLDDRLIMHALPTQRYCWPQIASNRFPFVCVSPEASGKTFTYLLYIVSQCITSIPVAITDEIISASDKLGSFSTANSDATGNNSSNRKLDNIPTNINHENFDFDSLGKIPETTIETNTSQPENDENLTNSSCFATQEHYEVEADNFVTHPKFIVICSSQQNVELINIDIEQLKAAAYGNKATVARLKNLPPITRALNVHQDEDKMALRCNESEILITTPGALIKCIEFGYINFGKCKMVFFDDSDQTLQIHNSTVRRIIKQYLIDLQLKSESIKKSESGGQDDNIDCQMYMFSRKWTDLLKEFINTVFLQKNLIFGSLVEASLYSNVRYEIDICQIGGSKMSKLIDLMEFRRGKPAHSKAAIVCTTNQDAKKLSLKLNDMGFHTRFLPEDSAVRAFQAKSDNGHNLVYILSDSALEFVVDYFNDVTHLIHFSVPSNSLVFDQRFRLMYRNIQEARKGLMTTIFINPKTNRRQTKELFDIISRSSITSRGTKLELRDYVSSISDTICWRWASTGICRLDKLSRDDRLGSYCPDKHSLAKSKGRDQRWPATGQVKIVITHLVSPSEFFFWFVAHRDINSTEKRWKTFESSGPDFVREFQKRLDKLKDTPSQSVPLQKLCVNKVYGVYLHQETRVDRVMLIEEPEINEFAYARKNGIVARTSIDYSQQFEFLRIDYGSRINVYLRNIFELPEELSSIEPQCHRAFHLGYQPTDGEPNWLYKAKKHFYELVCVNNLHEITAWLRMNRDGCFWLESLNVVKILPSFEERKLVRSEPHRELCQMQLAVQTPNCPSCLPISDRLETLSKWQVDEALPFAQYAFLGHKDTSTCIPIFLLQIDSDVKLSVRRHEFNKQLIRLEEELIDEHSKGKLKPLSYFQEGVYCIAEIPDGTDTNGATKYTYNRCRIKNIKSISTDNDNVNDGVSCMYTVECLDHGDMFTIKKEQLYLAKPQHLSILPFQAIKCGLADFNEHILDDKAISDKVVDLLYDMSRDAAGDLVPLQCRLGEKGGLYLYVPVDKCTYRPIVSIMEDEHNIKICNNDDATIKDDLKIEVVEEEEKTLEEILEMPLSSASCEMFTKMLRNRAADDTDGNSEVFDKLLQDLEEARLAL